MKQEHEMTPGVLVSGDDMSAGDYKARCAVLEAELAELRKRVCVPEGYVVVPVEPTPKMLVAINWPNDPAGYRAMLAAAPAPVERNQCDGCQAGIPVESGMHRMGTPGGYVDLMACTADRYGAKPVERVEHDHDAIALDKARSIMQIMYGKMPKGGSTQMLAMVQVCVLEAMSHALSPQPAAPAAQDVAGLARVLRDADEYLSANKLSSIGSGSILHKQMRDALAAHQSGGAK